LSGRKYPAEVWSDITREDLISVASNIMNGPRHIHDSTTYPVKTKDEIMIATAQEIELLKIKFAALRKEEEAKEQPPPTMRQLALQAPLRVSSRDVPSPQPRRSNRLLHNRPMHGDLKCG
jgi:hypothetical protein